MKNLKLISLVFTSMLVLGGCAQTNTPTESETSLKDKIENLSNYSLVTDATEKSQIVPTCDSFSNDFAKKVIDGDVKKLTLFKPKSNESWASELRLYAVPSYGLTESDFAKINACGELGSAFVSKMIDENMIFENTNCSGGAAPDKDQAEYADFQDCLVVEQEIAQYFGK